MYGTGFDTGHGSGSWKRVGAVREHPPPLQASRAQKRGAAAMIVWFMWSHIHTENACIRKCILSIRTRSSLRLRLARTRPAAAQLAEPRRGDELWSRSVRIHYDSYDSTIVNCRLLVPLPGLLNLPQAALHLTIGILSWWCGELDEVCGKRTVVFVHDRFDIVFRSVRVASSCRKLRLWLCEL